MSRSADAPGAEFGRIVSAVRTNVAENIYNNFRLTREALFTLASRLTWNIALCYT
ncbi:MAG: hypothetical protein JWO83_2643 [Caulobacteraceae bacterium]|jgi:hypothetical protein|nr:hypothetical protein [Caulobacteraceae bacterium]